MTKTIYLFASGDSRESANTACWPAQAAMEEKLGTEFGRIGAKIIRAHPFDNKRGHGFLSSQRAGMDAFTAIDPNAPVIIAVSCWQYSHHVLAGLCSHKGPILTVANWSGQWPGLVGMLNLNGSLTKAGVEFSTIWSEDFTDEFFRDAIANWLKDGKIDHDKSHITPLAASKLPSDITQMADDLANALKTEKSIMGVFDEGCMGMFNAIIPDALLMRLGVFKERLSQSALYHATLQVPQEEGKQVYDWLIEKGLKFHLGTDPATQLTLDQVLLQCRMYVAAVRLADDFDCETIGIQYQQGLKDLLPASDLVEGTLNNADRPDVKRADGTIIRQGRPVTHFNEVDECAGLDALLIARTHTLLGEPLETTLHDIRWGDDDQTNAKNGFVWVFEISGAAPPAHHKDGWAGSESLRQPAMYFPSGGGTLRGEARQGEIIWSRIFVAGEKLHMHIGRGRALELDHNETMRRRNATTPEWPIMHAQLYGVSRDQLMGQHQANHIQVVYASSAEAANSAAKIRAAFAQNLGIEVSIVGGEDSQLLG